MKEVLIVIPARGGSKGIPRKNLRPLAGKPMIFYSINASLKVKIEGINITTVVTTDDEEIGLFARRFGAEVVERNIELSSDRITLDPVIKDALVKCENKFKHNFDFVVTVQPTSPLVNPLDIEESITKILSQGCDTVLSVVDDRHLCWTVENGTSKPLYKERVNRQQLPVTYKETGAVVSTTRQQILKYGSRIGETVDIQVIPLERSFDIDTYADLSICEAMLSRKRIVFTVVGYAEVGLGHAFRALMLAHELVNYELLFVIEKQSEMAARFIKKQNYDVIVVDNGSLVNKIEELSPHLVINDILDTEASYIQKLKAMSIKVVNFEDLGSGANCADLVVNALYPHQSATKKLLIGEKYFCLRDEFLFLGEVKKRSKKSILITFGGVDEGNLTLRALQEITTFAKNNSIFIDIVVGPGYMHLDSLEEYVKGNSLIDVALTKETNQISEHMKLADIAITAGGRTVLELSSLKIPTIVICQNERELSHTFASWNNGVINLGHRLELETGKILSTVEHLIGNPEKIKSMKEKMNRLDLSKGKKRVIDKITSLI